MQIHYGYTTSRKVIDPTAFRTQADYTGEIRKAIRQLANHKCQQCKGEGLYPIGTAEMKLCRCVPIR